MVHPYVLGIVIDSDHFSRTAARGIPNALSLLPLCCPIRICTTIALVRSIVVHKFLACI